jgi:hypothetical protein
VVRFQQSAFSSARLARVALYRRRPHFLGSLDTVCGDSRTWFSSRMLPARVPVQSPDATPVWRKRKMLLAGRGAFSMKTDSLSIRRRNGLVSRNRTDHLSSSGRFQAKRSLENEVLKRSKIPLRITLTKRSKTAENLQTGNSTKNLH